MANEPASGEPCGNKRHSLRSGVFVLEENMESIYNQSHCRDMTAKEAVDNADKYLFADKKAMEFTSLLHRMAKAAGYKITERIVFLDMRTGKEYR